MEKKRGTRKERIGDGTICLRVASVKPKQWAIHKFLKRGEADDNLSAPSSLIANVHNEINAFYMEKRDFLRKKYEPIGGRAPPPTPLIESATGRDGAT